MRTRFSILRRFVRRTAVTPLALGLVLAACGESTTGPAVEDSGLGGLSGGPIVVSARTNAFGVPAALTAMVQVLNNSTQNVELTLAHPCPVGLRLYADAEGAGGPVWDSLRLARCRPVAPTLHRVIAPGDSLQEFFHTNEDEILGDSLSPGSYFTTALLVGSDGTVVELPTGQVELTGAELVDVTVRRGEVAVVPGTDLEIGLLAVADDQRCPIRDEDGNPIVCFWQGNADLEISLSAPGLEPTTTVLRSGLAPEVAYGPFFVRFFGLVPERVLGEEIEQDDYVATFRVVVPAESEAGS